MLGRSFFRRVAALIRLGAPRDVFTAVGRWILGYLAREFAFQFSVLLAIALAILVAEDAPGDAAGTVAMAALGALLLLELWFAWESYRSAAAVREELEEIPGGPPESRFPRSHLWFPVLMLAARSVRHERGVVFHREARRIVRLDIYRARASEPDPERRPAVVQVHGGGWILGSRVEQGIPLLNHLAANGWVGFNVDYRLSPRATLPDHVIDVKRAIAWIRQRSGELGVDPRRICITGGSAGAHLAALAALTADDKTLQPGFEDADTSVAAAVPFYGIYDLLDSEERYFPGLRHWLLEEIVVKRERATDPEAFRRVSPTHRIHPGAPPFLVIHGEDDSLVPVADAREFAKRLDAVSRNEALYVQLPGAQHAFDLAPSLRTARMVEGIERFLRTVVAGGDRPREHELVA